MYKKVKELKEKKNVITAEIAVIEQNIIADNTAILFKEILDLVHGVGNFIEEDEDRNVEARVYSDIKGVKNLRFNGWVNDDQSYNLLAKVVSPKGKLLPTNPFELEGVKYTVKFIYSKHYSDSVDY